MSVIFCILYFVFVRRNDGGISKNPAIECPRHVSLAWSFSLWGMGMIRTAVSAYATMRMHNGVTKQADANVKLSCCVSHLWSCHPPPCGTNWVDCWRTLHSSLDAVGVFRISFAAERRQRVPLHPATTFGSVVPCFSESPPSPTWPLASHHATGSTAAVVAIDPKRSFVYRAFSSRVRL